VPAPWRDAPHGDGGNKQLWNATAHNEHQHHADSRLERSTARNDAQWNHASPDYKQEAGGSSPSPLIVLGINSCGELARIVVVLALAGLAAAPTGASGAVHLRGTAYEFNNPGVRLGGAAVRVAEDSRLRAVTRHDGTYDLKVPVRGRVTPYIVAPGYHTIHLQTFRIDNESLDRVNFQTPTDAVYRALAGLLAVAVGSEGELRDCAIVSTFSTRDVRDLSFDAFTAFGAHGVAGATASSSPALPAPTYFNDQVLPDPAQRVSSVDGGVIWTSVPAGVYTIRARHPGTRFARFVATCEPGRIVNANPPWGLHELGRPMPATVSARWSVRGSRVALRRLRAGALPRRAVARVRCKGRRCPFDSRRVRRGGRGLAVAGLRAGQTIELRITAPGHDGKLVRWRLRSSRTPVAKVRCIPLGNRAPRSRC
jgi:hypothetical protein